MLYYFIRPFARLTFQMLYRNVRFSGMEHIPKGVPIIFATNHPSAFLEPCLMATWLPKPLSFIVRGDLFKTKFKRFLLASMHLVPMFRVKDGGLNVVKNNYNSIRFVVEYLLKKKWLMILAEGHITPVRRMGKMKKGTARIAFGTLDKRPNCGLRIIPVGVNFTNQDQLGTEVHFTIGAPIRVADYYEDYQAHNNRGIMQLTKVLGTELKKTLIQIPDPIDDTLSENVLKAHTYLNPVGVDKRFDNRVEDQKELCISLSKMNTDEKVSLEKQLTKLDELLHKSALFLMPFKQEMKMQWLLIIAYMLLAPFGLFVSAPYFFAKWVNTKIEIVDTFVSSVLFASTMGAGILYFGVLMIIASLYVPYGALYVLLFMNLGLLFKRFRYLFKDELNKFKFKRLNLDTRLSIIGRTDALESTFKNLKCN
ncbi:MAG: 1-acyl-sn-glycerol-3-phosphate acyltransferase [Saprospiraceae bacterium]|nr:1-acyl-sn-glycerol-3-phosphate acyltransferase [Saprospiraceae bacterium]